MTSFPYFIGLGHYKRTGKDTFASYIVEACAERGIKAIKRSFAWKLKQICHELYGWAGLREPEYYDCKPGENERETILHGIGMSPRQVWIRFGTNAVREQVYGETWVDYLLRSEHDADVVVIPDVRFPNEADALIERGATLIKVERPGYGPGADAVDQSLAGFAGWNYTVGQDGQLASLRKEADRLACRVAERFGVGV